MDALSAAASVIAVIQLAQALASGLKDYYEGVRSARAEIQKLYDYLKNLEMLLVTVRNVVHGPEGKQAFNVSQLVSQSGPLGQLHVELQQLARILDVPNRRRKLLGKSLQSLTWPLKQKELEKTLAAIESHKSNLLLVFGLNNLNVASQDFDLLEDIRSDIRASHEDKNRRRIVSWLSRGVPDSSSEHRLARLKHVEATGAWLLEDPRFQRWLGLQNSMLWLNGGAGVGKSLLCSTAIEYLKGCCEREPNTALAYWYFTVADTGKQNVSNYLSSVVADALVNRRDLPEFLQLQYDISNYGQQGPSLDRLLAMLKEVIAGFQDLYLVIDALDECPRSDGQREALLDLLRDIRSWKIPSLHILVTSRNELDITRCLDNMAINSCNFSSVPIRGDRVQEDMETYLRLRLNGDPFQRWDNSLKFLVQNCLLTQAGTMFRLVALQLDELSKLRTEYKVRSALIQLPRTLEEFYDRMLLGISGGDDQKYARRALALLCFTPRPILLDELAEFVLMELDACPTLDTRNQFFDIEDLLEILTTGMVTPVRVSVTSAGEYRIRENAARVDSLSQIESTSSDDEELWSRQPVKQVVQVYMDEDKPSPPMFKYLVQFAHSSVKEYLMSQSISKGPASTYFLDRLPSEVYIVQACFAYIMHVASKNSVYDRFLCTQHPFLQYAVNCWPFHVQYVDLHPISKPLRTILSEFLQYDSSAWHLWVAIGHSEIQEQIDTRWMTTRWQRPLVERCLIHPLTWVSAAGLFNTLEFLTQDLSIKNIPATPHFGNPLHAAAMNGQYRIVELLISRGMDVNECSGKYGNPLQSACVARYVGNISIVRLLLERGAQVNARGGAFFTALQAASFTSQDPSIVHLLLLNGADVNIQGGLIGSALAAAACHGDKEVVQMLLEAGANVNAEGGNRGSPIQAACSKNHPEILRMLLLHGANVNLNGQKQGIPIQIAAAKGNVDMVELLLKTEGLVIDTEQVERIFSILRMKIQWHIRKNKNLPRMDALKSILEMIELYVNRVGINSKESLGIIIKEEIKTISS